MRGKRSLFLIVTGFLLYVFDVGSDIYVAITYYQKEDFWWFGITVTLIILPSIICNIISLLVINNLGNKRPLFNFLVCVFQLSVIQQYWEALKRWKRMNWDKGIQQPCNKNNYDKCACENCKSYFEQMEKYAEYDYDLATTRYIEAFAESTPQWCLQFYIMLRQWSFPWITIVSTVFFLLSLAWGITSLAKTLKKGDKPTMTFPIRSLIVFTLWQLWILVSRLSAIVIFAYAFRSYVFIVISIHWTAVIVTILVLGHYRETYGNRYHCNAIVYCGRLFLISFPSLYHVSPATTILMLESSSNKKTLIFNIIYYGIFCLENVIMVSFSVWYEPTSNPHIQFLAKIVLPLVFAGFAIGMLFCGLYYNYFHPSKMEKHKTLNLRAKNDSNGNRIENEESQFCNIVQHVTAV